MTRLDVIECCNSYPGFLLAPKKNNFTSLESNVSSDFFWEIWTESGQLLSKRNSGICSWAESTNCLADMAFIRQLHWLNERDVTHLIVFSARGITTCVILK